MFTDFKKIALLSSILFLVLGVLVPAAHAQEGPHVRLNVIPERTVIEAGETLMIALEQTLDPGWHTYWLNPGDSGVAPVFSWTLPEGFEAGKILWPIPHSIKYGEILDYGYVEKATLLQEMTAPANLPPGPLTLSLKAQILVCRNICIPLTLEKTVTLNDGPAQDNTALIDAANNLVPYETGWPATYRNENGELVFDIHVALPGILGTMPEKIAFNFIPYKAGITESLSPLSIAMRKEKNRIYLTIRQKRGGVDIAPGEALRGLITYKNVNDVREALDFTAHPETAATATVQKPDTAVPTPPAPAPVPAITLPQTGFIKAFFFAILGGLILNLMPCVFPVLTLKVISLCKLSDKGHGEALRHGAAYTAGILLCFAAMGGIIIAFKSAGVAAGWGFQLQNPVVVLGLAWLLFVIGLNLSDAFQISGRFTNLGGTLTQKKGFAGSFFAGLLAVLVATPCTAPFMGIALGYTLTQPPAITLAVFTALGFGLALPFLLLSAVPALRDRLPKPGPWMETFKHVLALPLYASTAWLLWVLSQQTGRATVALTLVCMSVFAASLWLAQKSAKAGLKRYVLVTFALAGFAFSTGYGITTSLQSRSDGPPQKTGENFLSGEDWSPDRQTQLEAGNDPVFINMTAAWCITCKINERVALNTPQTRMLFARHKVYYLKGDWTNQNPAITDFLSRHGREGVPLYVFIGPRDPRTGQRPAPVILPQLLTPAIVAKTVGK